MNSKSNDPSNESSAHVSVISNVGRTMGDLVVVSGRILGLLLILLIALPVALAPLALIGVLLVIAQFFFGTFAGHYRHLIMQRLMRRKLIPLFAAVAVALCTAMVIIVLSVMGGFLDMLKGAGSTLIGDVAVSVGGLHGFPHYEELIEEIEKMPEAEAAAPIIQTGGLLRMPYEETKFVQVSGIYGDRMAKVTGFKDTLVWTNESLQQSIGYGEGDRTYTFRDIFGPADPVQAAMEMKIPWHEEDPRKDGDEFAAVVTGLEVNRRHIRTDEGSYIYSPLFNQSMVLTVVPVNKEGGVEEKFTQTRQLLTVNEFTSGLYDTDATQIFIPFEVAQDMLNMDAQPRVIYDDVGNETIEGMHPARTSTVFVKAAEGVDPYRLKELVQGAWERVAARHEDLPAMAYVDTWQERQAQFIGTVENEKRLMAFLFGLISIVSVVMVGVIFYTIVTEKTRDIGVLRALGASQAGIASIFLGFGAAIGAIGTSIGCIIGCLFVYFINEIHTWLGSGLSMWAVGIGGMTVGLLTGILVVAASFSWDVIWDKNTISRGLLKRSLLILAVCISIGLISPYIAFQVYDTWMEWSRANLRVVIWDRRVYFFESIPAQVNVLEVTVIAITAVIASLVGALLPAVKAAMVDPVESLRYE